MDQSDHHTNSDCQHYRYRERISSGKGPRRHAAGKPEHRTDRQIDISRYDNHQHSDRQNAGHRHLGHQIGEVSRRQKDRVRRPMKIRPDQPQHRDHDVRPQGSCVYSRFDRFVHLFKSARLVRAFERMSEPTRLPLIRTCRRRHNFLRRRFATGKFARHATFMQNHDPI